MFAQPAQCLALKSIKSQHPALNPNIPTLLESGLQPYPLTLTCSSLLKHLSPRDPSCLQEASIPGSFHLLPVPRPPVSLPTCPAQILWSVSIITRGATPSAAAMLFPLSTSALSHKPGRWNISTYLTWAPLQRMKPDQAHNLVDPPRCNTRSGSQMKAQQADWVYLVPSSPYLEFSHLLSPTQHPAPKVNVT